MNRLPSKPIALLMVLWLASVLSACTFSLIDVPLPTLEPLTAQPTAAVPPTATPLPQADYTFRVLVPDNTPAGTSVMLEVVDEVTGVELNPRRYPMTQLDMLTYSATLRLPVGSVVKYRYVRTNPTPSHEATPLGTTVRYRMAVVNGPGIIEDRVSRWADGEYVGGTGTLTGQVLDAANGQPVAGAMVLMGGLRTFTHADGTFSLKGLPPGKQTLVVYHLNGDYRPFQQGAVIAEGMSTPAMLRLTPAPSVQVTFRVTPPADHLKGAPIRLAGNLYRLGNTFADLPVGETSLAVRMPVLQTAPDGTYSLTLALPVGLDLHYKYTLGDGFWNAERNADGSVRVREIIIPDHDLVVDDQIASWSADQAAPIFFDVYTPADTPPADYISLQLNPGLWTVPIPMWPLGGGHWGYQLYGPMALMRSFTYRYCRNDLCDLSAEASQSGSQALGHPIEPKRIGQHPVDKVQAWQNWPSAPEAPTIQATTIQPRPEGFVRGVALLPAYAPAWQSRMANAMQTIAGYGADTVFLSPTWAFTFPQPLIFDPQPGEDMLLPDLQASLQAAEQAGLTASLFPQPRFAGGAKVWWSKAPHESAWWDAWFQAYTAFALHYAQIAEQHHLPRLVLGGEAIAPALPGGTLPDGSPSGVPADAAQRWRQMLAEVHNRFSGEVWWAMPVPDDPTATPPFLDQIDGLYLQFDLPLSESRTATLADMQTEAARLLDGLVHPFQIHANRPVWLAVAYPSADGGATGCVPGSQGVCLSPTDLAPSPTPDPAVNVDLEEQVRAYNALLLAVNERDWISGFISEGFFPPAALLDASPSIHGKPAGEVLRYWFQQWH